MNLAFDGLVCDMDGVIYRGDEPVPGSVEAVRALTDEGVRVLFCTNNSRSTVSQYVAKLERMGIEAEPACILTSAVVTGEVLAERGSAGRSALVVGGDGVGEAMTAAGLKIVDPSEGHRADIVVVGLDPGFTYERMKQASSAVRAGALFIATNDDATFPAADDLWPGAGAVVASIEVASGAKAEVMGKPHEPMMRAAASRLAGCERIAIVGDRPDTDLAGGIAMGWTTILVLSGVTGRDGSASVDPAPDVIVERLADLVQ